MSDLDILLQEMDEKWKLLSGSDQFAVEKATQYLECDGYVVENLKDDDLMNYVYKGCQEISEGNAEPEYADEDFFEEEANSQKVFEYMKLKQDYEKIRKSM